MKFHNHTLLPTFDVLQVAANEHDHNLNHSIHSPRPSAFPPQSFYGKTNLIKIFTVFFFCVEYFIVAILSSHRSAQIYDCLWCRSYSKHATVCWYFDLWVFIIQMASALSQGPHFSHLVCRKRKNSFPFHLVNASSGNIKGCVLDAC